MIPQMKKPNSTIEKVAVNSKIIKTGAERTNLYLHLLKGKNVAIVGNQTSSIKTKSKNNIQKHLVDSLLSLGIKVKKVFAPEHGFRGEADAGEIVKNGIDTKIICFQQLKLIFHQFFSAAQQISLKTDGYRGTGVIYAARGSG